MNVDEMLLREQAVQSIRKLDALGLNRGSTGNLSQRCARCGVDGMLITPTGMGAEDLRAQRWLRLPVLPRLRPSASSLRMA